MRVRYTVAELVILPAATKHMPWCVNCVTVVSAVVSCPPAWVAVDVSTPANLFCNEPLLQCPPVPSCSQSDGLQAQT